MFLPEFLRHRALLKAFHAYFGRVLSGLEALFTDSHRFGLFPGKTNKCTAELTSRSLLASKQIEFANRSSINQPFWLS